MLHDADVIESDDRRSSLVTAHCDRGVCVDLMRFAEYLILDPPMTVVVTAFREKKAPAKFHLIAGFR